ncbi:leucine carboxyl methyltransferase 1 [Octopus sinensis]|uniref:Leucine carboxyl methyltransferase 1 n=1 Tax=Octopus sinensis TaxID=2607531 RepID=A0A6P7SEE9_9MOLL|nr:leucine carboxyl methyltransferase 1 [Octopus sinensis]
MASDEAVMSTNDDASQCKRFAVDKGYWIDPYISMLAMRGSDIHTPEINRGYYARVKGIHLLLEKFLKHTQCNCQVINLGAGYDTTFWQFKDKNLIPKSYIEVDFQSVTAKKCHYIKSRKRLLQNLTSEDGEIKFDHYDLHSDIYHLIGADLRNVNELEAKLKSCNVDYTLPTVFVTECVLVYMETNHSNNLIKWIADNFQTAFFINYEQVHMNDKFGQIMICNLKARQCDLPGVSACTDFQSQTQRFLTNGWEVADMVEMTHVYASLPQADVQRIEKVEFLDEHELLQQLLSHYCITYAFKDPNKIGLYTVNFSP